MQGGEGNSAREGGPFVQGPAAERGADVMIPMYEPGKARGAAGHSWISPRGPALRYGGLALLGVVVVGVMIFLTLPMPKARTTPTGRTTQGELTVSGGTPTATAGPKHQPAFPAQAFSLPAFSDWRVAYLGTDGAVYVTSLDGANYLTGPVLNLNTADTTNGVGPWVSANTAASYTSIAIAPNGRYLAYINAAPLPDGAGVAPPSGALALINLAPDANTLNDWTAISLADNVTHIAGWSPDSAHLAVEATMNGLHGIYEVTPSSASLQLVPHTDDQGTLAGSRAIGWLDNTHLLLMTTGAGFALPPVSQASAPSLGNDATLSVPYTAPRAPGSSNGDSSLATVEVSSGTAYEITRVPGSAVVALAPDGKEIEAYSGCQAGCAALAPEVVDTATGQIHALPNSADSLALQGIALWQPGGSTLAVTITGQGPPKQWSVNLVNTQTDSARALQSPDYTIAWSPDGQHLLLGDTTDMSDVGGQTTITVVSPASGAVPVNLPQPMSAFIGFVKTA